MEMTISMLHTGDEEAKPTLDEWNARLRAPSEYCGYLSANCSQIATQLQLMMGRGVLHLMNAA